MFRVGPLPACCRGSCVNQRGPRPSESPSVYLLSAPSLTPPGNVSELYPPSLTLLWGTNCLGPWIQWINMETQIIKSWFSIKWSGCHSTYMSFQYFSHILEFEYHFVFFDIYIFFCWLFGDKYSINMYKNYYTLFWYNPLKFPNLWFCIFLKLNSHELLYFLSALWGHW